MSDSARHVSDSDGLESLSSIHQRMMAAERSLRALQSRCDGTLAALNAFEAHHFRRGCGGYSLAAVVDAIQEAAGEEIEISSRLLIRLINL